MGTGNVSLTPVHAINKGSGGGIAGEEGVAHTAVVAVGGTSIRDRANRGRSIETPCGSMAGSHEPEVQGDAS